MAAKLITLLCGNDEGSWREAQQAAVQALEARKDLWDGMLDAILQNQEKGPACRS